MSGYRGWDNYSRYLSNFLSMFIHTSKTLTDISPLTQLIAVFITSLSSIILLYLFKRDKKITFSNIMATVTLTLFPFFLANLSYKFDSVYMGISILVCIVPFLFYKDTKKGKISFIIAVIIGTILMCTSYQAASGILILVALFLAFKEWNIKEDGIICSKDEEKRFKKVFLFLIYTAVGYVIGLLIFRTFIMQPVNSNYVSSSLFPLREMIPGYISNMKTYYKMILHDFRTEWLVLICLVAILFIIKETIESNQRKIYSFILAGCLLLACALYAFGIYPFMTEPLFAARAMYGFGVFLALMCICITDTKWTISIPKIVVVALAWCFIVFTFTYGNALYSQQSWIDFRIQNVIDGMNELEIMNTDEVKTVKINGNIGKSPQINNMNTSYRPMIDILIKQTFGGTWWNYQYFQNYFGIKNMQFTTEECDFEDELETAKDTMYYTIKTNNEDYVLIELK